MNNLIKTSSNVGFKGLVAQALIASVLLSQGGLLALAENPHGPYTIQIDTINGSSPSEACLLSPVTIAGSGHASNPIGGNYYVQVVDFLNQVGDPANGITITKSNETADGFDYSFSAEVSPVASSSIVKVRFYHGGIPGGDGDADVVASVDACVAPPTDGILRVIKHVIGGDLTASAFTLYVSGVDTVGTPGSETGTDYVVAPGTYNVSEAAPPADYTQTSVVCDGAATSSVAVAAGQTKECTITNSFDQAPPPPPPDTEGPVVAITSPAESAVTGPAGTITYTVGDSVTVVCTLDSVSVDCSTEGSYLFALGDGSHTFTVQGTDSVGNAGNVDSVTWTVDATGPVVAILLGPADGSTLATDSGTFTFEANETATFECQLDGATAVACDGGSYDFSGLADGPHTFSVAGTDALGNVGPATTNDWTVDTELPPPPPGEENTAPLCSDGVDNDGDSLVDLADPDCAAFVPPPPPPLPARLTVIKYVTNNDGGSALVSDFSFFVGETQVSSNVQRIFDPGTYILTETNLPGYTASVWGYDCAPDGTITLVPGDVKTCTITNDDDPIVIPPELPACADGIDNDNDGNADFAQEGGDSGCTDAEDNNENTPPEIELVGLSLVSVPAGSSYSDAGATAHDPEDGDQPATVTGTVDTNTPGTYVLHYNYTDENGASAPEVTRTVEVTPSNTETGGSGGGTPPPPSSPTGITTVTGGGGLPFSGGGGGQVLGASASAPAGEVLGAESVCGESLGSYIKYGANNDPEDVRRLQEFLNGHMNAGLPVTGFYGALSRAAVEAFQVRYSDEVLRPWVAYGLPNEQTPTGYVYKTTKRKINNLACPDLNLPIPQLP